MKKLLLLIGMLFLTACTSVETTKSIDGYITLDSPTDGSCVYIRDVPLSMSSDSSIICYPPNGCAFVYSEQCVRITGTIGEGSTLTNCTYEVVAPTSAIQAYNEDISSGVFATLDEWLVKIANGLNNPDEAEEVSSAYYESLLMSSKVPQAVITSIITYTQEYNEWLSNGKPEDNTLNDTYSKVQEAVSDWFESLRVVEGE